MVTLNHEREWFYAPGYSWPTSGLCDCFSIVTLDQNRTGSVSCTYLILFDLRNLCNCYHDNMRCVMGKCALAYFVSVPVHADTQVVSMVTGNTGTRQAWYCTQLHSWPTCLVLPSGTSTTSTVRTWGQWLPWWVAVGEWVAKWGHLLAAQYVCGCGVFWFGDSLAV